MTALVPPRPEPLTLKQALEIYGASKLRSKLRRRKHGFILIRVVYSHNGGKYLRELMPDIWGKTFVFTDRDQARSFLLSLEDVVRARETWQVDRGVILGGVISGVRWLVRFLIEEYQLSTSDEDSGQER